MEILQKKPDKDFTIVEFVEHVYGIKSSRMLTENYLKPYEVMGALNSLFQKDKVEMKLVGSPRYAILYRLKKKQEKT